MSSPNSDPEPQAPTEVTPCLARQLPGATSPGLAWPSNSELLVSWLTHFPVHAVLMMMMVVMMMDDDDR